MPMYRITIGIFFREMQSSAHYTYILVQENLGRTIILKTKPKKKESLNRININKNKKCLYCQPTHLPAFSLVPSLYCEKVNIRI